jgi:predicted deacetylase
MLGNKLVQRRPLASRELNCNIGKYGKTRYFMSRRNLHTMYFNDGLGYQLSRFIPPRWDLSSEV